MASNSLLESYDHVVYKNTKSCRKNFFDLSEKYFFDRPKFSKISKFSIFFENKKMKICVWFFRLWLRVCLAFHAQSDFLDEPKCVERAIAPTFQRTAARLQTRKPREMRTEKLTSVKLIREHSLQQHDKLKCITGRYARSLCSCCIQVMSRISEISEEITSEMLSNILPGEVDKKSLEKLSKDIN